MKFGEIEFQDGYEYELWALGYNGDFVVPMEEQIGETATDAEELKEMLEEAKSLTIEDIQSQFAEQIKKHNVTSIQLQVEEISLEDETEDERSGEPVYERLIELSDESDNTCQCPLGGDESDDCTDCTYGCDYHFENGECVPRNIN